MNHVDEVAQAQGIGAKEAYAISEVVQITGWHKRIIYEAVNAGELTVFYPKRGMTRYRHVKSNELQRWVDSL